MQEVLGPGGQDEASGRCLGSRGDAVGRQLDVVDPLAVEVLDGAPGEPRPRGFGHRGCDAFRVVGEAVLEVGRDRYRHRPDELRDVGQRLVAGHSAVDPAERGGEATARRRQCLEPQRLQRAGRADVPRVRHDQG